MSERKIPKKLIIFFGDSLTEEASRLTGFISLINRKIEAYQLVKKIGTINAGISGNRVYDLLFRIQKDVLSKSPHITVILIGINDVWCKTKNGTGVDVVRFEKYYREIIIQLVAANSKIVLCTLPLIGELPSNENPQDAELIEYSQVIESLAKEYQLPICNLRNAFVNYLNNYRTEENFNELLLTTDGVHLNDQGNQLVAMHLWDILEKELNIKA